MLKKLDKEFIAVVAIAIIAFIGFGIFSASQLSTKGWANSMKSIVEETNQANAKGK